MVIMLPLEKKEKMETPKKTQKITIHWCVNFLGFIIFELKCTF